MKKFVLFVLLAIAAVMMTQCDVNLIPERYLVLFTFRNNSSDSLVYVVNYEYPDTLIPYVGYWAEYAPPLKDTIYNYENSRKYFFNHYSYIHIYVFIMKDWYQFYDTHELNENILKYNLHKKSYELTKEWLEQHDWTVTYP